VLDGGAGTDLADHLTTAAGCRDTSCWSTHRTSIEVDLAAGSSRGFGTDRLVSIEAARGGDGPDVLHGDAGTNVLVGAGGGDVLAGRHGDDRLLGGRGDDTNDGGAGSDFCRSPAPSEGAVRCEA
jgi:Ca2+-binding RTX toxin-like protein